VNAGSQTVQNIRIEANAFDFESVFHAQYERIARVIAKVVRDPARAEELAVEVFWKLWRNPQAQGDAINGWLYRAAIRMALDELRKQSRRQKYEQLLSWPWAVRNPEELHSETEEQAHVRTVLACLPVRQSELLLLRACEGLSYQDIAHALGLNPASVGTLLSRAQESFRKEYLKRYGA
jgi:RNA polymerase sigma-70 factor (ECF subfamily)